MSYTLVLNTADRTNSGGYSDEATFDFDWTRLDDDCEYMMKFAVMSQYMNISTSTTFPIIKATFLGNVSNNITTVTTTTCADVTNYCGIGFFPRGFRNTDGQIETYYDNNGGIYLRSRPTISPFTILIKRSDFDLFLPTRPTADILYQFNFIPLKAYINTHSITTMNYKPRLVVLNGSNGSPVVSAVYNNVTYEVNWAQMEDVPYRIKWNLQSEAMRIVQPIYQPYISVGAIEQTNIYQYINATNQSLVGNIIGFTRSYRPSNTSWIFNYYSDANDVIIKGRPKKNIFQVKIINPSTNGLWVDTNGLARTYILNLYFIPLHGYGTIV